MDITGEYLIPTDRETVWKAINDPEMLKACIPGCQELTETDEGEGGGYAAKVQAKIGPVKATFNGHVRLEDVVAPESYSIVGEGKGGAAGFAKGGAKVHLEDMGDGTTKLSYAADAQVGGKLAQLGSRLIQGTARKYADDFFNNLTARIAPEAEPERVAGTDETAPAAEAGVAPSAAAGQAAAETPERPIPAAAAARTTAGRAASGDGSGKGVATWMWWAGGALVAVVILLILSGG